MPRPCYGALEKERFQGGTKLRICGKLALRTFALVFVSATVIAIPTASTNAQEQPSRPKQDRKHDGAPADSPGGNSLKVDRSSLVPKEEGNTLSAVQSLSAVLDDGDLDRSTLAVALIDRDSGATQRLVLTTTTLGNRIQLTTNAVPLRERGRYEALVTGRDRRGTEKAFRWQFRRLLYAVAATDARIDGSPGIRNDDGTWSFLPEVQVGEFTVTASETEHSGFGPVGQRVPLTTAKVRYTYPGLGEVERPVVLSTGESAVVYKPFQKAAGEGEAMARISWQRVWLAPVRVSLPRGATNPVLVMSSVPTLPVVPAACGQPRCNSDPLPYYMPEDFAEELLGLQMEMTDTAVLGEAPAFVTALVHSPVDTAHWQLVSLDTGVVDTGFEEEVVSLLDGVAYEGTLASQTPSQYDEACAEGYACTWQMSADMNTEDMRNRCVRIDGRDTRDSSQDCRQFNVLQDIRTAEPRYYDNRYRFSYSTVSQIGYADNYSSNANEELGIAWNDEGAWQWVADSWRMARYDYYWCDGDESWLGYGAPVHHHFASQQSSDSSTVNVFISPYGVSYPGARQWKPSSEFGLSSTHTFCRDYYEPGGIVARITTEAIARARILYIDATWKTNRTSFQGTAVGSVGHVWKNYSYSWSITAGGNCGSSGCGVGAGFTFNPHSKEKAERVAYPRGYSYP